MNAASRISAAVTMGAMLARGFHFHPDGIAAPNAAAEPPAGAANRGQGERFAAMREEHARLLTEANGVIAAAEQANRDLTAEERTANDARFSRISTISNIVNEHARFASMALQATSLPAGTVLRLPTDPPGRGDAEADRNGGAPMSANIDKEKFGRALTAWAGTGQIDQQFATITTATASSILLPKQVLSPIATGAINSFREGFQAWGMTPIQTPGDTSTFNVPVMDPTAGGFVAENATAETQNAPTLAESIVSTVGTYQSGSVYYSNLQLSAVSFDLLSATVPTLEFNKELGLESTIVAAMIADGNITQAVTTAATGAFTFGELVAFNNKLPKRYQFLKVMLLSADAYTAAEALVDDNGRPIMVPDPQNMNLKRIGGTPCIRCDYLQTMAAGHVVGIIVSLVGFHMRDAGTGIQRYTQVPAKPNQTGVNLFSYHAYGYAVSAVAVLKMAAA